MNLIGIESHGLMHTKMRIFETPDLRAVVSGSLNPETTAMGNDDTLLVLKEDGVIDRYSAIYDSILTTAVDPIRNEYKPEQAVNVLFSHGVEDPKRDRSSQVEGRPLFVCIYLISASH